MFGNRKRGLKTALTLTVSAGALMHALSASAQAAVTAVNIPAQPVDSALRQLAVETGTNILFSPDSVRGLKSRKVEGHMTVDEAARELTAGTSLEVVNDGGSITVRQAEPERVAQIAPKRTQEPATSTSVETVVVTAEKKKENIQQVPIAITALSQQQLTERQVAGGPDLVKEVPNLTFSKTNFTGYNLEIRGIGTQAISVTTDPAVAVAFNDIPFIRNHFFEQEFYDLQDVEVLRGPQGTLYGRNATAGAVNIKSALPTDQYEAMLSADLGNYNNRRLEAMLNLPITGDQLDIRFAGEWTKRDGYSFNEITDQSIDGRDLWSGRMTIGWKPASNVQTYLVWEHFSEDDDRMRTAKQLCKTAPIPASVDGVLVPPAGGDTFSPGDFLSQGCLPTSLYSPNAFEVPNGFSLPYYSGLVSAAAPIRTDFDVYSTTTQSENLRVIDSSLNPVYRAKNDTLELNTDYTITPALTLTSQTGYNNDFLWSTEDYDRFNSAPGIFVVNSFNCGSAVHPECNAIVPDPAAGTNGIPSNSGVFCDPQLGCSDRLVAQDLSEERSWQLSQEFRLASNFSGPLNFSVGGSYLHYETEENYFVFINTLSLASLSSAPNETYVPGVTDNSNCLPGGMKNPTPSLVQNVLKYCPYIDPNPIGSLNGQGHNYFLSQNPYVLNSYAGFGEVYYDILKDLKLTGGLRWTEDRKHFLDIPSEVIVPGYGYTVTNIVDQQWDQLTGRAAVNWTPNLDFTDQTLMYGSYAHGYKAGGANPPGAVFPSIAANNTINFDPLHPLTFKPEFIDAYELGTKNTLLDGTLTLNGDVFFYNYTNYQISRIVDRTSINDNFNATVRGAELETNWEAAPGLKFSFAGGYENATLDKGDSSVDLIDRTAGNPNWTVVKPTITTASNCILPNYVVAALLAGGGDIFNACSEAYNQHIDPVNLAGKPAGYPGFDPVSPTATNNGAGPAPNNGEGFAKQLGGNQLPNAPHFTTSFTAEYTLPVSQDWAATLHGDFYWQSQSWARVFNDNPYDKLHGYSNVNLSVILTSANGWQVMGYVKNVFNVTAITGDFLNSDDTGLTTNVFLTDPRLFGVRVTKHLDENDGFWGSDWSGTDFFTGLFSDTDKGKPRLWIELGGQLDRLVDSQQPFEPAFIASVTKQSLLSALSVQSPPTYGLDEEGKISFQPEGSDWIFSGAIRYGRSAANKHHHQQTPNAKVPVHMTKYDQTVNLPPVYYPTLHEKFADGQSSSSERKQILDFLAGKDVGLGMFGLSGSSVLSGGVRIAQFTSVTNVNLHAEPDVQYPNANLVGPLATKIPALQEFKYGEKINFHDVSGEANFKREFHGIGPTLAWAGSEPFLGASGSEGLFFDWGANAAVLFGRQTVRGSHKSEVKSYYKNEWRLAQSTGRGNFVNSHRFNPAEGYYTGGATKDTTKAMSINRSRAVTVPNLGAFIGLSMKYQNAKVSFGYRVDEFFGAMDGGIDTYKSENRAFFGPYANLSIGLGG